MNGICGIMTAEGGAPPEEQHIAPMIRALGPGEERRIVSSDRVRLASFGGPSLGSAGTARSVNHPEGALLAFTGTLFNLEELIPTHTGEPFESLLNLLRRDGTRVLERLRGDYALAFYGGAGKDLRLAVDRFRVYPLYYYQDARKFVFASRLESLLACPLQLKLSIDPESIVHIAASSVVPTPKSIYREIKKLPAGHVLSLRGGEARVTPYWDISFLDPDGSSRSTLVRKLKEQFTDSLRVRLRSDEDPEKVGSFLSGGVDSSTVTGEMQNLLGTKIKSFSVGFEEQSFNEIGYARIAARAFGARHYEYFVTPGDVLEAIPVLLEAFDEPFANASAVPTFFCARLARQHGVESLYAGDGGDELFAGNERYSSQRLFDYYGRVPALIRNRILEPLVLSAANGSGGRLLTRAGKYIRRAKTPYPERLYSYGFFQVESLRDFVSPDLLREIGDAYNPYAPIDEHYRRAPAVEELDRQLYVDLKLTITDNDIIKVTRMAEAAGVKVRYPFLDHRLAEFAARIPARMKMRGRRLRTFFKEAYADLLPAETRAKQKHGFGLPIAFWLKSDTRLHELMQDLVMSPRTLQRGFFQKAALERLLQRHQDDRTTFYGTALWNLMMLELWLRRH